MPYTVLKTQNQSPKNQTPSHSTQYNLNTLLIPLQHGSTTHNRPSNTQPKNRYRHRCDGTSTSVSTSHQHLNPQCTHSTQPSAVHHRTRHADLESERPDQWDKCESG